MSAGAFVHLCANCGVEQARQDGLCSGCGVLADLLYELERYLRRYVVFASDSQSIAVTLWAAHVFAIEAADATPYLRIKSAAPECGKSTLLDVLELLFGEGRAINAVGISPSVVFRMRDKWGPVALLLDEVDNTLRDRKDEGARDLLALVNGGYKRSAKVYRVVGSNFEPRAFRAFGPAAIAGIGNLSPATESRSIPIELVRKPRNSAGRFLSFRVQPEAADLGARCAEWASAETIGRLRNATPEYPEELSSRQVEGWWALLNIADLAGSAWPARARDAALALHLGSDTEATLDVGTLLLAHCRRAFEESNADQLSTADLLRRLVENEEGPWGRWWGADVERASAEAGREKEKPEKASRRAAAGLAQKLRPFKIRPRVIRIGKVTPRGYTTADFAEAWDRYLPSPPATPATHATPLASRVADVASVAGPTGEGELTEDEALGRVISILDATPSEKERR